MIKMKVQLIHPPTDGWYRTNPEISALRAPPGGLATIAKATKSVVRDVNIQIIDGNNMKVEEIKKKINEFRPDLVGVSDWYSKHLTVLDILRYAHSIDAITAVGGPNANHLAERLLKNHDWIDYVFVGAGEVAFPFLVRGDSPSVIPNLVYRTEEGLLKRNQRVSGDKTIIFDLEDIVNLELDSSTMFPVSAINGCIKVEQEKKRAIKEGTKIERNGRCSFCSMDELFQVTQPDIFWKQARLLRENYGIRSLLDSSDSFIAGTYPEHLLVARPSDLKNIEIGRIFVAPDQLNGNNVMTLKKLNVRQIFLGVESVDDTILKRAGKAYRRKDIERAVDLIFAQGMLLHVPFMYGLPGETEETAKETYLFAKGLVEKFPGMRILAGNTVPLVGTELFEFLRQHSKASEEYSGDLELDDYFDYRKLVVLQTKYRSDITMPRIDDYIRKTRMLGSNQGNVGSFGV